MLQTLTFLLSCEAYFEVFAKYVPQFSSWNWWQLLNMWGYCGILITAVGC